MSTHTSADFAEMLGFHQSAVEIRDNVPDSFKIVLPRQLSKDILSPFDLPTGPSTHELYDLQVELDHQSLQRAIGVESAHDATSVANSAKAAALKLAGPLSECGHSGRFGFQQIQFRALIASLALLHHSGVAALDQAPWDKLKLELAARFRSLAYQMKPDTTLADGMRHAANLYLVQVASQYLSFIRRGDSALPLIVGPAFKVFFATIAMVGGQYNHAQQILEALNELLALWQRPQAKYRALCGLQECIRLVVSLTRETTRESAPVAENAAAIVVSTLLDKINALLAEEDRRGRPKVGGQWPKVRATFGCGPPDLNRGGFYYGLLDCLTQLSGLADTNTLRHKGIFEKMTKLIFGRESPEYRWKAVSIPVLMYLMIEVLLSCRDQRNDMYNFLKREMEEGPGLEARELGREARETLLEELKTVREHLAHNEQLGLRFCLSRPLTELPTVESIQSEPAIEISPIDNLPASGLEQDLIGSRPRTPQVVLQMGLPTYGLFNSTVSYHFAGLSIDCKHAVLYNVTDMAVFRLELLDPSNPSPFPSFLRHRFTNENIFNILLGRRSLIVVTNSRLLALDITQGNNGLQLGTISHGNFDYSGITCHENGTDLVIILGQRQGSSQNGYIGRIKIIKFKFGEGRPYDISTISLSGHDYPKLLSYNADTETLVCITRIQNRVVAWKLDHNFLPLVDRPFDLVRNRYTEETRVTGITSASTFKGPSGTTYVACTTSPSSERYRNDGEWSFILPLSYTEGPRLRPPNPPCHDLGQFTHALTVGCVSKKHHVLAVLEDSGKISILSLMGHEEGGICGEGDAERLSEALCKQEKPSTSCLRFDPDGERLFAVDPRGKIIITDFERV